VPLLAIVLSPRAIEIWVAGIAVVIAMILTGAISARLGRIAVARSVIRNVAGGLLAMGVTYGVGNIAGTQL
jgi:VIT1/CCC1 family predicted Fe2+/Mn2+ transporter